MLEFEASVKVRFESIFAWPFEHTRQGPYLVVTKCGSFPGTICRFVGCCVMLHEHSRVATDD